MSAPTTDLPDFDTIWNYDDPAATEQQFRALLPRAGQGDNHSYHAQLLTQIARVGLAAQVRRCVRGAGCSCTMDITYIRLRDGWLFLMVVLDWFSH
jgi:hypothetical protein